MNYTHLWINYYKLQHLGIFPHIPLIKKYLHDKVGTEHESR